jgi:hypothetical protein
MPWMPDKASLKQGMNGTGSQTASLLSSELDIRAVEKRILSAAQDLNEILTLLSLLTVPSPLSLCNANC